MNRHNFCMTAALAALMGLGTLAPVRASQVASLTPLFVSASLGANDEDAVRAQASELLKSAREAMRDGDLARADQLISQAEKLNPHYNPLLHFGDTPRRARQDFNKSRPKKNQGDAGLPSGKFSPASSLADEPKGTSDPFIGQARPQDTTATPPAENHQLDKLSLPRTNAQSIERNGGALTGQPISQEEMPAAPLATVGQGPAARPAPQVVYPTRQAAAFSAERSEPRAESRVAPTNDSAACKREMTAARLALAVGDARTARKHLAQARSLAGGLTPHDDSPEKVEATILKYEDVVASRPGREESEGWKRNFSESLLEQADALLANGQFDEAERLATSAQDLGIPFAPFEANPRSVLERITAVRKESAGSGIEATPPVPLPVAARAPVAQPVAAAAPPANSAPSPKARALALTAQARAALASGQIDEAEQLVREAVDLKVRDSLYAPGEDRPNVAALEIYKARAAQGVVAAGGTAPDAPSRASQALYTKEGDITFNAQATAISPLASPSNFEDDVEEPAPLNEPQSAPAQGAQSVVTGQAPAAQVATGEQLFQQGSAALRARNKEEALRLFREAYQHKDDLDAVSLQRLQDHLQMLSVTQEPNPLEVRNSQSLLDTTAARQQLLQRQLSAEITREQTEMRRLRDKQPKQCQERLQALLKKIETSGLDEEPRKQLRTRVDLSVKELEKYLVDNRAQIELSEQNRSATADIERKQKNKLEVQKKLSEMSEEFNRYWDTQEYEKMVVVAKRAREFAPDDPFAKQMYTFAQRTVRMANEKRMSEEKEGGFLVAFDSVENSGIPMDDRIPVNYDTKHWSDIAKRKEKFGPNSVLRKTEKELEIEQKLRHPVSLNFQEMPLAEVMDNLSKYTGINIHLDPRGLAEEGVSSNTPVTLTLPNEVSLKSALHLILDHHHLSYVVKDEVLKITSEQLKDGEVYTRTYNVADLVIPIPNFTPGNSLGLQGSLNDAYATVGVGQNPGFASPNTILADSSGHGGTAAINPQVLAQMNSTNPGQRSATGPISGGPGGMGGGVQADFDSLIELITATIQPNTWDEVGGPGSVKEFATNLSLVVSQTQDVHEEIVDLLEQLRRLQDLQVTIEVRFIRLNDNFFERIGVDFDFNIEDKVRPQALNSDHVRPSATVGLAGAAAPGGLPAFSADLDIPFRNDSFTLATPGFGTPVDVASFGFAILSDIEAFFLINAAQGDRRSNILQAPKVTLFNGQQAFVSDTSQTPFVISVIPVVGDFAAAQQPVIVVLSEGTFLTIQAVVSNDRRYVRLTVVPFFSQIGDVKEFTFDGQSSTVRNTEEGGVDDDGNPLPTNREREQTRSGTAVQLPTFLFVTVTTTVSVPDGGTVLLGGIKRLSEARTEFGVPLLSKVPYISRLFRNVGVGRDAESLMMMVTPRIIIQEEEEEKLGIGGGS